MGKLIRDETDGATMDYDLEKLDHGPTGFFPVRFNKDQDGNWKISFF